MFNFEYQWDGYYKIIARHSGMALDVYNSEQSSGANVEQYPWKNSDNQKWVVKPAGDGYYYIVSKGNGLYLDVYGGVAVNDANIDTYFGHGGASEKWRLIPVNEPENLLTVKGCSVSLKENIGVNMYASFSDDILEDDGAKVRFTYADNSYIEVPLSNYMSTTYNNENVKKITFDTVPAKLTEKIKVSVIKSDDTQTNMFSFSTSDYLYALINSTDKSIGANQKNIAKALLNYGAYSQIYFGVDTADLANKKLTDNTVEKTDSDTVIKSIQGQENGLLSNKDFEYIGSSLVCDSSTDLKLYFVNKSRLTMKQIENQYDLSVANKNTHGFDVGTDGNILWIKDKRQDCETQAIFATHSTVIVDALDHQDIVLVRREKDEKRGFHSSTSQLPVDFWTLHNIAELKHYNFFKYRNSDFFFAKYVVITESITDAQVIERLIEPQLGDLYYNVSVLNLDGVKNLQYPFFLLSDLGIPFTAVVDKDVFLPYKNGKLMDSRNSETFLPEYSNTLNRRNPVLNAVFNTEELKDKLEEYVNQSYTKFVNYIEKYNMLSMQYCLEMDLVATDKASELYYDHYNLLGEKRNRKSLLIERKDAIKDPTVLLEIFDRLNPSEYPFSFKKIKNILVKKIKTAIITQRQNMEVEE